MRRTGFFLLLLAGSAGAVSCRSDAPPPAAPSVTLSRAADREGAIAGNIVDPAITEASGLAASRRRGDVLWVLNDSGNPPEVFAVSTNGAVLARHPVPGIGNRDWEDLASFVHEGTPYLVIAETGDNEAVHETCALYVVEEPAPAEGAGEPLPLAWQIRFRYEDGPRDCESVAVDPAGARVLLLSKRDEPPVLYELPLQPQGGDEDEVITARRLGALTTLPRPTADDLRDTHGRFRAQPTAMDLTPDGRALAILTYKNAYLYDRDPGQSWIEAFVAAPRVILLPHPGTGVMRKREALCFSSDAGSVFVTSEGQPAPLFRQDGLRNDVEGGSD